MTEPEAVSKDRKTFDLRVTNAAAARDLWGDFVEVEAARLESVAETVRLATRANEHAASVYEKLILLDTGAIGLSLTLIGYLTTRGTPAHFPLARLLWLVCPAWLLLVISIWFSLNRIVAISGVNALLIRQWSARSDAHHQRNLGALMHKASKLVKGEITSGDEKTDAEQLFKEVSDIANQSSGESSEMFGKLVKEATKISSPESLAIARTAFWTMLAAFILLCAFTVTALMRR